MRLIKTRAVLGLTGLSADQLREWTSRRALISPDVKSKGRGSSARFSWQTVLILRLAIVLKDEFRLELQAHRELFVQIRDLLNRASFPGLWDMALALHGMRSCELVDPERLVSMDGNVLLLRLNPHLEVLSVGLGIARLPLQLSLFPAVPVQSHGEYRKPEAAQR